MADQEDKISQFVGVTGVDPGRAKFYLESAAWDLQLAMSSFFDGGAEGAEVDLPSESVSDVSMPTDSTRRPASNSNRVGNINYLKMDSDSSEEEGEAFYAGGSDRSGQQVLGPPKKKKDPNSVVESLFKSARDHGAEEKREDSVPGKKKPPSFTGSGYRLGETSDDSTMIPGASVRAAPTKQDKKLKLWKNGFSVGDGPLRDYNDPQNKVFLDSISRGEVPQELVREAQGGEVNLDMEDHRGEDYTKPKVTVKAFTGQGQMLGSPAPSVATPPPTNTGASNSSTITVDSSQPTTNVQLRLADGSRMVVKMNHCHKVSDIRSHIVSSHPQYSAASFCLMTTFPNKELTEENQTLAEASLLNAVVVQRLK